MIPEVPVRAFRVLPAAFAALATLAACGPTVGSGTRTEKTVPLPTFQGVRFEGAFAATVTEGPDKVQWADARLVIDADDNLVPLVRSEVKEGALRVWIDGTVKSRQPIRLRVLSPKLSWVAAAGAVSVDADALAGDAVHVILDGASSARVGRADGKKINLMARGASKVTIAGEATDELIARAQSASAIEADVKCAKATLTAEGASSVKGPIARNATVSTTGTSSIELDATETLTADSIGVSSVIYGGKPKVGGSRGEATTFRPKQEK